jgi:O-antigen/teichoic acid export membrane protein
MSFIKRESPIVSSLSNLISSWIKYGTRLISGILIARSLGPELKGQYSNLALIVDLYLPFLLFGYAGGVLYYGIRQIIDLKKFYWTGFLLAMSVGLAVVPGLFFLARNGWLGTVAAKSDSLAIWLVLTICPAAIINLYSQRVLQAFHLFRATNIREILGSLATLAYYIVVALVSTLDLKHAIVGLAIGYYLQTLLNLVFAIRVIGVEATWDLGNIFKPWNYGIRTWLNFVISRSSDRFDQIALTFFLLPEAFGIYTVGVSLSSLVGQIPNSYAQVFFNQVAERQPEEAVRLYAMAQRVTLAITTVVALLLALVAYPLVYVMYGTAYWDAGMVILLYTPGLIFQAAARMSVKFYAGLGRPLKNSLVYLVGFSFSLPFYLMLIPVLGIYGAAIASSIAYFAAFTFSFLQIHREFGVKIWDLIGVHREDREVLSKSLRRLPVVGTFLKPIAKTEAEVPGANQK